MSQESTFIVRSKISPVTVVVTMLTMLFVAAGVEVVLSAPYWPSSLALILVTVPLALWWEYCRITITPKEITILSSGWRKEAYRCLLADVAMDHKPPLRPVVSAEKYPRPLATIELDDDFDTDEEYVYIEFHNQPIDHCFSVKQYAAILTAYQAMIAQHEALATKTPAEETR